MGGLTSGQKAQIQRLQNNLSALRRIAGWSMEELGSRIGVTRQTISNLESSGKKANMSLTQYLAIRAVLDYEAAARLKEDKNDTLLTIAIKRVLDDDLDEDEMRAVEEDVALIASAVAGKTPHEAVTKLVKEKIGIDITGKIMSAITATSIGLNACRGLPVSPLLLGMGMFGWMGKLLPSGRIKETQAADNSAQNSDEEKE